MNTLIETAKLSSFVDNINASRMQKKFPSMNLPSELKTKMRKMKCCVVLNKHKSLWFLVVEKHFNCEISDYTINYCYL